MRGGEKKEEEEFAEKNYEKTKKFKKYKVNMMKMTVKELRNECESKELKKSGKKKDLQQRLIKSYDPSKNESNINSSSSDEDSDDDDDDDDENGGSAISKKNEAARIESNSTPQYLLR